MEHHRRHEELAGFWRNCFSRIGERCNPVEDLQRALMKSKILDCRYDLSFLDEKRAVSRHAREGEIRGIDRPDVPEVRHKKGSLCVPDQLLDSREGRS